MLIFLASNFIGQKGKEEIKFLTRQLLLHKKNKSEQTYEMQMDQHYENSEISQW